MSRIGKKIINIPDKVKVEMKEGVITIQGPKGTLSRRISDRLEAVLSPKEIQIKRKQEGREFRSVHGLTRTLVDNMVKGVTDGFEKRLEMVGLGYKAQVQGQVLSLNLGYTNPIQFDLPKVVQAKVEANTKIVLTSPDKEILGVTASEIRKLRLPEPYKGTGIKYEGEVIVRKVGKTAAGTSAS
ncbi:MAG: 50S ribosomal protein L6 [Deltaproteobacteria bacterium GWA2_38_16]|nr:MAG: 50S ribosomal protein L6 [Deltaproteobacteria bacterium GWA2_38_16]OGQ03906.1 MAG: 50S ribosomal protein L6 [Deltaproteobacteria bacterium RIFCSPHIGHO2_02_FULL_38_15]OGQ34319.1 MAG: 50S ribosomal protein L6 [Deltaproteobacteria bacterium RIFCSPLOWO2_01_FULL_38_9]OGQ59145.1 MAG: 50S ribosomal protein L6 [Deltaproteobacteria bacterium RIFCSPLOWO2_12_FULL_38_8]HBQ20837.1 50S ribosomal protein L6 [Deltaproteobacteria bacterium]